MKVTVLRIFFILVGVDFLVTLESLSWIFHMHYGSKTGWTQGHPNPSFTKKNYANKDRSQGHLQIIF